MGDQVEASPEEKQALEIITLKVGSQARAMLRQSDDLIIVVCRKSAGIAVTSTIQKSRIIEAVEQVLRQLKETEL